MTSRGLTSRSRSYVTPRASAPPGGGAGPRAAGEGAAPAAAVTQTGRLHLDHLGAEVGHQLAGVGRADAVAALDDAQPLKRSIGHAASEPLRGRRQSSRGR